MDLDAEIARNIPKGSKFVQNHTDAKLNWHSFCISFMQLVSDSEFVFFFFFLFFIFG